MMGQMCYHVLVTPLLHLPMLEKVIIELRNGNIFVRQKLSDLLKAPPRDDVVEAAGGNTSSTQKPLSMISTLPDSYNGFFALTIKLSIALIYSNSFLPIALCLSYPSTNSTL